MPHPSKYMPSYIPKLTDQRAYISEWSLLIEVPCCVGNTLAYVAEIFRYRRTGESRQMSVSWIYGNRNPNAPWYNDDEGMYTQHALARLVNDGVSFRSTTDDIVEGNRLYNAYLLDENGTPEYFDFIYLTAKDVVSIGKNDSSIRDEALENRITGYSTISWSNVNSIKDAITRYGACVAVITNTNVLKDTGSDGIVREMSGMPLSEYGHTLPMIGWKTIDGKTYWVCPNSWGEEWGDEGWCYVPYDFSEIEAVYKITDNRIPDVPSEPSSAPVYTGRTYNRIELSWGEANGANFYDIFYKYSTHVDEEGNHVFEENIITTDDDSTSWTLKGLSTATTYYIKVRSRTYGDLVSDWVPYDSMSFPVTTRPRDVSLELYETTSNSIEIDATLYSIYLDGVEMEIQKSPDGEWKNLQMREYTSGSYITFFFDNLEPETTYNLRARSVFYSIAEGQNVYSNYTYYYDVITPPLDSQRPNDWIWRPIELNCFDGVRGYIMNRDFTYERWNEFIDRVNEFRVYQNKSEIPTTVYVDGVGTVSTKMTSTDKKLYAERFNVVRLAIGEMYSTGITDKSRGERLYGGYFTAITNSLNSIS